MFKVIPFNFPDAKPHVSVIVCASNADTLSIICRHIASTIGIAWEFIGVDNSIEKLGICEVYNKAGKQATTDVLVFVHDDVFFSESGWGQKVFDKFQRAKELGVLGLAGTDFFSARSPFWYAAKSPFIFGRIIHHTQKSFCLSRYSVPDTDQEVVSVDGLFIASSRSAFEQHGFDQKTFDYFHFYDVDYCARVCETHKIMVTTDILVKHLSGGSYDDMWRKYKQRFQQKYGINKFWTCSNKTPANYMGPKPPHSNYRIQNLYSKKAIPAIRNLGIEHPKHPRYNPEKKRTNILFIHPNFPGQFKYVISYLQQSDQHHLAFITRRKKIKDADNILIDQYQLDDVRNEYNAHRYLKLAQDAVLESERVIASTQRLEAQGFVPDIIVGHTGWGGLLHMRDRYPNARIVGYFELYYKADEKQHYALGQKLNLRCQSFLHLSQLDSVDIGITPTKYQLNTYPKTFHSKLHVMHEGVDSTVCKPDPEATFPVAGKNLMLSRDDMVITYVSRGFEPMRGFFEYMAAVEIMCKKLPEAHFLLVGGDGVFHSKKPGAKTYREQALKRFALDPNRVHFTGKLIYEGFKKVMQISSAHVYLSKPLFLSWSALEAKSIGAPMVVPDLDYIHEFFTHEVDCLMVDYNDPKNIADAVQRLVENKTLSEFIRNNARQDIVNDLDISLTIPKWLNAIQPEITLNE